MSDDFATNIIRLIASELRLLNSMTAGRDMFGKSYFSLGPVEKAAVDQAVNSMVAGNFVALTPKYFAPSEPAVGPVGFHVGASAPKTDSTEIVPPQLDISRRKPEKA